MQTKIVELFKKYAGPLLCLLTVGFIDYCFYIIFLFSAFGFLTCGEDVKEWHNVLTSFIMASALCALQIFIAYLLKRHRLYRIVFWCLSAVNLLFVIYLGTFVFNYSHYYKEFDKSVWSKSADKPMAMARTMYEDQGYLGKTREQVIADLGEGDKTWRATEGGALYYQTDRYVALVFEFKDDKVAKCLIYCED